MEDCAGVNTSPRIRFSEREPTSRAATELIDELSRELAERYRLVWPSDGRSNFRPDEFDPTSGAFVIGELDETVVCCGAIRRFDETTAEIKRMYVRKIARGRGVGARLLAELERLAMARDYRDIVLETGSEQPEALALYERAGYSPTRAWPPYDERPYARCFRKALGRL